jgi:hypothetical protein
MQRITNSQLENLCQYINTLTNSPMNYRYVDTGNIAIGHFSISHAYGGVCVHRTVNEGGGCSTPIVHGHVTKRELYDLMHAFIKGLEFSKYELEKIAA